MEFLKDDELRSSLCYSRNVMMQLFKVQFDVAGA